MATYNYTTPLIINHAQVSGSISNFPVLLSTNSVLLSTASAGGHMLTAYDLVFSTFSDCHYLLHWDSETVNATGSGQLNYWVNVPSVSSTTDTVFYSCYGNAAITSYRGISTATWDSNYGAVWHLPNGTTLNANDSTVNGNTPSATNGTTSTSGQIDGAAAFDGSSNYIQYPDASSLQSTSNLTVSVWVYLQSYGTPNLSETFLKKDGNYISRFDNSAGGTAPDYNFFWFDGTNVDIMTIAAPALNSWHYFVTTVSGNAIAASYLDGSLITTSSGVLFATSRVLTNPETLGGASGGGENLQGNLDEVRMSNSVRSSDWILTEYNNQISPSSFIIFDTEINNTSLNENEKGIVSDGGKINLKAGRLTVK